MRSFVDELLDKQQISRRRCAGASRNETGRVKPGKNSGGSIFHQKAYRPAGISSLSGRNSRFIDGIEQNPARFPGRREHDSPRNPFPSFSLRDIFAIPEDTGREEAPRGRSRPKKRLSSGLKSALSVPAIPFTALLIFALGVFFLVYNQAGAFDWTDREVVSTEKDEGSQYNLALYAGVAAPEKTPEAGEPIPLDLTETFTWQNYKVKRGDSVSKIAAAHSVSMDAIIASNGITNARALREGEELRIPNMDGIPYTVKNGDSLSAISKAMGVPTEAILDANDLDSDVINAGKTLFIPGARMNRDDLKMALGELFVYPVRGARLSSPFGWRNDPISGVRRHHAAIDLSAPQGTPIKAAMDGKVSSVGYNANNGNFVIISHGAVYKTMYAHLHTVLVKNGERVGQGSQIGTVGSTGYSTGPHLHFSVYKNNRAVNPLDYLNPRS